jgi:hypothetical protein
VKTKGEEKNRRSDGGIECNSILRGKKALSDGSFQVHVSLQWIRVKLFYPSSCSFIFRHPPLLIHATSIIEVEAPRSNYPYQIWIIHDHCPVLEIVALEYRKCPVPP